MVVKAVNNINYSYLANGKIKTDNKKTFISEPLVSNRDQNQQLMREKPSNQISFGINFKKGAMKTLSWAAQKYESKRSLLKLLSKVVNDEDVLVKHFYEDGKTLQHIDVYHPHTGQFILRQGFCRDGETKAYVLKYDEEANIYEIVDFDSDGQLICSSLFNPEWKKSLNFINHHGFLIPKEISEC